MGYIKNLKYREIMRAVREKPLIYQERKANELSKDSLTRQEIYNIIENDLKNGKTRLEILIKLTQNPEYKKYNKYFKSWIDHRYTKHIEKNKGKSQDEYERD